jgi:phage protein U
MFAQLGNIIFEGLNGFESFEHKDSTTYAQHDIIGAKPVIVPTGNDLEEININIRLRAEFIKPEEAIIQLKNAKDNFEVLPLVKGSGRYMGDFVIVDYTVQDVQSFPDGTTIEATVQISLKEYAVSDKLQQQQAAAKKNAFATGDKKPLSVAAHQSKTVTRLASDDLVNTQSHADAIEHNVSQYENNVSKQQSIADKIQASLKKMDDKLSSFNDKLNKLPVQNITDIISGVTGVKAIIQNFSFPITSIDDLKLNNRNLQSAMRGLNRTSISITDLVITRRA